MISFPLKLTGSQNSREHWRTRAARVRRERTATAYAVLADPEQLRFARLVIGAASFGGPRLRVTMTRISARDTDDDNRTARLKGVRDELAVQLGLPIRSRTKRGVLTAEDSDPRVVWVVAWRRRAPVCRTCGHARADHLAFSGLCTHDCPCVELDDQAGVVRAPEDLVEIRFEEDING